MAAGVRMRLGPTPGHNRTLTPTITPFNVTDAAAVEILIGNALRIGGYVIIKGDADGLGGVYYGYVTGFAGSLTHNDVIGYVAAGGHIALYSDPFIYTGAIWLRAASGFTVYGIVEEYT